MKTVSAAEANRHFSKILRDVRAGETILVTSRGEPVAKIVPAESEKPDRAEALRRLLARLDAQPALNLPRIRRDELYDN
jgi:prevent-host-death family protein